MTPIIFGGKPTNSNDMMITMQILIMIIMIMITMITMMTRIMIKGKPSDQFTATVLSPLQRKLHP